MPAHQTEFPHPNENCAFRCIFDFVADCVVGETAVGLSTMFKVHL